MAPTAPAKKATPAKKAAAKRASTKRPDAPPAPPYPITPPVEHDASPVSASDESAAKNPTPSVIPGDLVAYTYEDFREGAGGAPVTRYGVVVDVQTLHPDGSDRLDVDGAADPGARIAWLEEPTDPVSLHDLRVV